MKKIFDKPTEPTATEAKMSAEDAKVFAAEVARIKEVLQNYKDISNFKDLVPSDDKFECIFSDKKSRESFFYKLVTARAIEGPKVYLGKKKREGTKEYFILLSLNELNKLTNWICSPKSNSESDSEDSTKKPTGRRCQNKMTNHIAFLCFLCSIRSASAFLANFFKPLFG